MSGQKNTLTAALTVVSVLMQTATVAQELEVDHVWIHVDADLDGRSLFENAGFRVPSASDIASTDSLGFFLHQGVGTASIVVRFRNIYLELIRVDNRELLQTVAPEHGYTLLNAPRTSPFGVGLKLADSESGTIPFETSSFWAPWMRPLVSIAVARRDDDWPGDPAIFVVPDYMRWDLRVKAQPELLLEAEHSFGLHKVTGIRIYGPDLPSGSEAAGYLATADLIEFVQADDPLLELELDSHTNQKMDFRPTLPLLIHR